MAKKTVPQADSAAAPNYCIEFPVGPGGLLQVWSGATNATKQEVASCMLESIEQVSNLFACSMPAGATNTELQHVFWSMTYLTSIAKGLVDSMSVEGETP